MTLILLWLAICLLAVSIDPEPQKGKEVSRKIALLALLIMLVLWMVELACYIYNLPS